MTLRGQIADFPIETVLQLLASTGQTRPPQPPGEGQSAQIGKHGGRLAPAGAGAVTAATNS